MGILSARFFQMLGLILMVIIFILWRSQENNAHISTAVLPLSRKAVKTGNEQLFQIEARVIPKKHITSSDLPFMTFDFGDGVLNDLLDTNCRDNFTVPPIVHYVWLSKSQMVFHEYVSVFSASRFLKPCYILVQGDTIPTGKWWTLLLEKVRNIIHVRCSPPKEIFNKKINLIEHQADVLRLEILMRYGGIYLDTDMYILKSLDPLRNHVLTLGREGQKTVANSIILANKNSYFLKIWYLTYSSYNNRSWAENSVFMSNNLCRILPSMVHVEREGLVKLGKNFESVYNENLSWNHKQYSVHLYSRTFKTHSFEISYIKGLKTTFGALSRYILFGIIDTIKD